MSELNRTEWIWKDGAFVRWEDATLHVMSHVVHYGSSVFEGIRCYATPRGPAVFRLREHMRRLVDSARIYRMPLLHDADALSDACCELIARNELDNCYIRPVVLRGFGALGINPIKNPIESYIACFRWGSYLGVNALEHGVDVCVSSWSRPAPNTMPALAKAGGNYLSSQLIKMEAVVNGFDDAIALSPDGIVSEGSGQNVFAVRDGTLLTPPVDGSLLAGITRDSVLVLARELDIPVRETTIPRELLYCADELFFTGTASELTPIRSVDRITIGDGGVGRMTRLLQQQLLGVARGALPDHHGWLTPVPPRQARLRESA
jgi:branched-chain amino acid aminotransferase